MKDRLFRPLVDASSRAYLKSQSSALRNLNRSYTLTVHLGLTFLAIVAQIRQAPASFGNARDRVGGHHSRKSAPAAGSFRAREENNLLRKRVA